MQSFLRINLIIFHRIVKDPENHNNITGSLAITFFWVTEIFWTYWYYNDLFFIFLILSFFCVERMLQKLFRL